MVGQRFQIVLAKWMAAPGMTLRDWFAGQALAGAFASPEMLKATREAGKALNMQQSQVIAKMCVEQADALIALLGAAE